MTVSALIDDLIARTEQLTSLIEADITLLKGRRPAALSKNENDRAAALLHYSKAVASFKSHAARNMAASSAKQKLKAATVKLQTVIAEEQRLLARFRHVTEGLIKSVAQFVADKEAPKTYAKSGAMHRSYVANHSGALTLNQAI